MRKYTLDTTGLILQRSTGAASTPSLPNFWTSFESQKLSIPLHLGPQCPVFCKLPDALKVEIYIMVRTGPNSGHLDMCLACQLTSTAVTYSAISLSQQRSTQCNCRIHVAERKPSLNHPLFETQLRYEDRIAEVIQSHPCCQSPQSPGASSRLRILVIGAS